MNLLTITRDLESPPGGWKYTVPETGMTIQAPYGKMLRKRVINHLLANSLPVPDEEVLTDAICRESGHGGPYCGVAQPPPPEGVRLMTWSQAKRFISTIMEVARDRQFVSPEEAERRAAICAQCPALTSVSGCRGCSSVFRQAAQFIRGREVRFPKGKEFCGACGCYGPLKVLIPNGTLNRAEEGADKPQYEEGCWRLDERI